MSHVRCIAVTMALALAAACGSSTTSQTCSPSCPAGQSCMDGQCRSDAVDAGGSVTLPTTCPSGYVRIEPGTFTMGSPTTEPQRADDEAQHQVTLTRAFCMKATEVTRDEFFAVTGYHADDGSTCSGSCPEVEVRWMEANAYCNALSRREGLEECYACTGKIEDYSLKCPRKENWTTCKGYRLPSEAEWEYAARAGSTTAFSSGDHTIAGFCSSSSPLAAVGWFCGNSSGKLQPVKGKQANAWGLYDMLGNAQEWTNDSYAAYPTGPVTDPIATTGGEAALRGGAFDLDAEKCRLATRASQEAGVANRTVGFRPMLLLKQ